MDKKPTPKVKNPGAMITLHMLIIAYVIYLFYTILRDYLAGGENAPSLTVVILGGILLLGGAVLVACLSVRLYRQANQAQKEAEQPEEAAALPEESSGEADCISEEENTEPEEAPDPEK